MTQNAASNDNKITLPSDQNSTGRTLGTEEITNLSDAINSGVLTSTKGSFVKELKQRFASIIGAKHGYACSSGTTAIHCAVACAPRYIPKPAAGKRSRNALASSTSYAKWLTPGFPS